MAALAMKNLKQISALPTKRTLPSANADLDDAARHFTQHYLSHRKCDIPGTKDFSKQLMIDSIVNRFKKSWKGDYSDDGHQDLKQTACLLVHECARKYVNNKKQRSKFDFCVLATEYLKFKLKYHIFKLNINKLDGTLPDSKDTRTLYSNLTKYKKGFGFRDDQRLSDKAYKEISFITGIKSEKIKLIDQSLIEVAVSGDKRLSQDQDNDTTLFDITPDTKQSIDENLIYQDLLKIINKFLKKCTDREKKILTHTKLYEIDGIEKISLTELSKIFNISIEGVRLISEKKLSELKKFIELNLKC